MNPLELTEQLIAISGEIDKMKTQAFNEQEYYAHEYNDITHALELTKFNASEGYSLAKQMQDNRSRRREAKDAQEQLEPLLQLINKHKSFFKELKNVHVMIEQIVNSQQKRRYRPRVRDDLFKELKAE